MRLPCHICVQIYASLCPRFIFNLAVESLGWWDSLLGLEGGFLELYGERLGLETSLFLYIFYKLLFVSWPLTTRCFNQPYLQVLMHGLPIPYKRFKEFTLCKFLQYWLHRSIQFIIKKRSMQFIKKMLIYVY